MPAASVRTAVAALSFLTRVPVGRTMPIDAADVARSTILFPLVGAGIGAAAAAVAVLLHPTLPAFLAAAIAVGAAILVTGAMHLDALADTFDAAGATTRDRALEVMRDPRLGTFGVAAVVFDSLIKVGAVAVLLDRGGALAALVAAGALSRAAGAPLAAMLPYPRAQGGPGSVLTGRVGGAAALATALLGVALAVAVAGVSGAIAAGAVAIVAVGAGLVFARWLGGATGDSLGATTEVAETVALVVLAGLA
jgi:adenosylcobinamide-GDP ribazoletransferase